MASKCGGVLLTAAPGREINSLTFNSNETTHNDFLLRVSAYSATLVRKNVILQWHLGGDAGHIQDYCILLELANGFNKQHGPSMFMFHNQRSSVWTIKNKTTYKTAKIPEGANWPW